MECGKSPYEPLKGTKPCQDPVPLTRKGFYRRPSDGRKFARYHCKNCRKTISESYFSIEYRLRKRWMNQPLFRLLGSGVSQRRCAIIFQVKPSAIARRVDQFARCARNNLAIYRATRAFVMAVQFDEMESFEHTKCKPLTIPIAVEEGTRKILSLAVGQIAAKGHLAEISRKKYGRRLCERKKVLASVFTDLRVCTAPTATLKSDESQHYPKVVKEYFPEAMHVRSKGQRARVIGQGELKKGFDPIFSLNHTYAKVRDNLKTLSRRTWCTAKIPKRLEHLLFINAWFHNLMLDDKKGSPKLHWLQTPN